MKWKKKKNLVHTEMFRKIKGFLESSNTIYSQYIYMSFIVSIYHHHNDFFFFFFFFRSLLLSENFRRHH